MSVVALEVQTVWRGRLRLFTLAILRAEVRLRAYPAYFSRCSHSIRPAGCSLLSLLEHALCALRFSALRLPLRCMRSEKQTMIYNCRSDDIAVCAVAVAVLLVRPSPAAPFTPTWACFSNAGPLLQSLSSANQPSLASQAQSRIRHATAFTLFQTAAQNTQMTALFPSLFTV